MPNQPPERLTGVQPTHALATSVLAARRSRVLTVPRERVPVAGTHRAPEPLNPMIESILECWCRLQVNRRPEIPHRAPTTQALWIDELGQAGTKMLASAATGDIVITAFKASIVYQYIDASKAPDSIVCDALAGFLCRQVPF
jgi:hypothetical protein